MRRMMRFGLAVLALVAATGCGPLPQQPDWRRVGEAPHQWKVPPRDYDHEVHGPMPVEEARDDVDEMASDGWELIDSRSAAPDFPASVILTYRRK